MFPGVRDGKRVNLNNVLNREIKPVLKRCTACGKTKAKHIKSDHDYWRDERLPEWHGWHAFRRVLATNLHDLGIDDKTILAILRHSGVSVTQKVLYQGASPNSVAAMNKLESALCAERVLEGVSESVPHRPN